MKDYNGFSGADRNRLAALQRKAIKEGILKRPGMCEICFQTMGLIMLHNEDYDQPIDGAHSLCVECRTRLRNRFFKPKAWHNHLARVVAGYMSKPYQSVPSFFHFNFGGDDVRLMEWVNPREHWYQRLPGMPVIFRRLEDRAKEYFR